MLARIRALERRTVMPVSNMPSSGSNVLQEMDFPSFEAHVTGTDSHFASIRSLTCYRNKEGIPHEFLVLVADSPPGIHIRLERAADRDAAHQPWSITRRFPKLGSSFSLCETYTAKDRATIADNEPDLIEKEVEVKEKMFFRKDRLPVWKLLHLLRSFSEEAKHYTLFEKNCWFLCSVIMENLDQHSVYRIKNLRNAHLGEVIRAKIKQSYDDLKTSGPPIPAPGVSTTMALLSCL